MFSRQKYLWNLGKSLFQFRPLGRFSAAHLMNQCNRPHAALAISQFRFLTASASQSASERLTKNQKSDSSTAVQQPNEDQGEYDVLYKSIQLEASSADRAVLDSYEKFVTMAANFLEIPVGRIWEPYRHIKRRTLLRAAFVKKKYRVQYEFRTYFRSIELKYLTGSTADTFLEYIERNLPEGTSLKVIKTRIEKLPSHLKPPQGDSN